MLGMLAVATVWVQIGRALIHCDDDSSSRVDEPHHARYHENDFAALFVCPNLYIRSQPSRDTQCLYSRHAGPMSLPHPREARLIQVTFSLTSVACEGYSYWI